jgi:5-hydroxyisourate hydrolase
MAAPITCHVLNTVSGTPASGLEATLTLLSLSPTESGHVSGEHPRVYFRAVTNEDGRVKEWEPAPAQSKTLDEVMSEFKDGERTSWSIKFEVGPWYEQRNIESFWPEVEVKFYVKKGERHYHVPVLVGPWTFTTYRGS